jgi:hypothetical protein
MKCAHVQQLTHVYTHTYPHCCRKGNTTSVARTRHVGISFGKESVQKYSDMLAEMLHNSVHAVLQESAQTDSVAATESGKRANKVAVISLTEDLHLNVQRSGAPPQTVDGNVSRVNLWRNEGVCLQQVSVPFLSMCVRMCLCFI